MTPEPTPRLSIVQPASETAAEAATRLQHEATQQAVRAIEDALVRFHTAEAAALEITDLTAAPHGIREECRQLASQISARAATIMAITGRGM